MSRLISVVLPAPVLPTRATLCPASIVSEKSSSTSTPLMYEKHTCSKVILHGAFDLSCVLPPSSSAAESMISNTLSAEARAVMSCENMPESSFMGFVNCLE